MSALGVLMYNLLLSMADSLFLLIAMDKFIASMLTLLLELLEMHKTVFNNNTQNARPISRLGSATGKKFNTYFWSSPIT
jgi:hypothetical protein